MPLQPLSDNLDCSVYETFEKDPIKYTAYQRAVEAAIRDLLDSPVITDRQLVIMVVGAGRGPLVALSFAYSIFHCYD